MSFLARLFVSDVFRYGILKQRRELTSVSLQIARPLSVSSKRIEGIKRPLNSYFVFTKDKRPSVVEKHPELTLIEISKILSQMWKEASESEKTPYYKKASDLSDQYKANKSALSKEEMQAIAADKKAKMQKKMERLERSRRKKERKFKKPLSSYNLFYKLKFVDIARENSDMAITEVCKYLGNTWKSMSDADKQPFLDEAKQLKIEYERKLAQQNEK